MPGQCCGDLQRQRLREPCQSGGQRRRERRVLRVGRTEDLAEGSPCTQHIRGQQRRQPDEQEERCRGCLCSQTYPFGSETSVGSVRLTHI